MKWLENPNILHVDFEVWSPQKPRVSEAYERIFMTQNNIGTQSRLIDYALAAPFLGMFRIEAASWEVPGKKSGIKELIVFGTKMQNFARGNNTP